MGWVTVVRAKKCTVFLLGTFLRLCHCDKYVHFESFLEELVTN